LANALKLSLKVIGLAGFVLFSGLFGATFLSADSVERVSQAFIQYQVEKEVRETYGRTADSTYGKALGRLKGKYEAEARQIQAALDDNLPKKIANVIAALCRLDCKQRQALEQSIEGGYQARHASTGTAVDTLTELIRGKYLEVVANLTRDVRIFLGSNALLFLMVALLALLKPQASMQLYLPSIFLVVSTVVCSGLYLFGQNWFFTIIYNDYVGFSYVAYVAVLFGFLCDIAFNKARVTTELVNAALSAIGSAVQAIPC
jgi:hypothetical protein